MASPDEPLPLDWQPRDRPLGLPAAPVPDQTSIDPPISLPPPVVVVAQSPPTSGLATASLVVGIVAVVLGLCPGVGALAGVIALAMGHQGLHETKTGAKGGRGLAVAGLILGYLVAVPWLLFFVLGGLGHLLGNHPPPTSTP